jgi:hypothetical protein
MLAAEEAAVESPDLVRAVREMAIPAEPVAQRRRTQAQAAALVLRLAATAVLES